MKQITPFRNLAEASQALDNGGHFLSFRSRKDDGIITKAELRRAAGAFSNKQKMMLFLELSMTGLSESEQTQIVRQLEPGLQAVYQEYKPARFNAKEAREQGEISQGLIVTGIPKMLHSAKEFRGFIMIPINTGTVTTFTMIPLIDRYDVYEIRDEATDVTCLVAHAKGKQKLPEHKIQVAGVLKELKAKKDEPQENDKFLEVLYHYDPQAQPV